MMLLLLATGMEQEEADAISRAVDQEVEEAVLFARESPYPAAESLLDFVFKEE